MFVGAGVCVMEGFTDIFSLTTYYNRGYEDNTETNKTYRLLFKWNLMLCLISILLQLVFAVMQYYKKGPKAVLRESFFVLTFTKPIVDGYRLVTSEGMNSEDQELTFTLLVMYIITRLLECCVETVPGSIMQVAAMLKGLPYDDGFTIPGIACSALATGFIAASITYDLDTDPMNRRYQKYDFNIFPDDGLERAVVFTAHVFMSSAHVLVAIAFFAVMISLSHKVLVAFFVVDWGIYVILYRTLYIREYKVGSLLKLGKLPLSLGFVVDGVFNVFIKAFNTFVAVVVFKSPGFMGGLFWTSQLVMLQGSSVLMVWVYAYKFDEAREFLGEESREDGHGWLDGQESNFIPAICLLCAIENVMFAALLYFIKPEHRTGFSGFLSVKSNVDCVERMWDSGEDDVMLYICILYHVDCYQHFLPEYREWFEENFAIWEASQPYFYYDDLHKSIPAVVALMEHDDGTRESMSHAGQSTSLTSTMNGRVNVWDKQADLAEKNGMGLFETAGKVPRNYRDTEGDVEDAAMGEETRRKLGTAKAPSVRQLTSAADIESGGGGGEGNEGQISGRSSGGRSSEGVDERQDRGRLERRTSRMTPATTASSRRGMRDSTGRLERRIPRLTPMNARNVVKVRRYRPTFMDRVSFGDNKNDATLKNAAEETLRNLFEQMHVDEKAAERILEKTVHDPNFEAAVIKQPRRLSTRVSSVGAQRTATVVGGTHGEGLRPTLHFEAFCDRGLLYQSGASEKGVGESVDVGEFDYDSSTRGISEPDPVGLGEGAGEMTLDDIDLEDEMALNFDDAGTSTIVVEEDIFTGSGRNMLEIIKRNVTSQLQAMTAEQRGGTGKARQSFLQQWS